MKFLESFKISHQNDQNVCVSLTVDQNMISGISIKLAEMVDGRSLRTFQAVGIL